jgi:NhaP-type Na+/H+ and K+/H+ antiporter
MNDIPQDEIQTDHASPYPVSRLAPAFGLVDLAQEIAQADEMLANRAGAQLKLIAEQVRALQQQAQAILQQTQRDQQLHRARCNFQKKPGQIYHLYHDSGGQPLLSLLSPEDWRGNPPNQFMGSFRLESDRSWTPLEQLMKQREKDPLQTLQALLQSQDDN